MKKVVMIDELQRLYDSDFYKNSIKNTTRKYSKPLKLKPEVFWAFKNLYENSTLPRGKKFDHLRSSSFSKQDKNILNAIR